tara:strand:- start:3 stop:350 length:348 start_codon:yes stop_codon:yes gene_type:complete
MKKLFYLASGVIFSASFLSISDANAKMVSKGLITTKAFKARVLKKKVISECKTKNDLVLFLKVNMPNPSFKAVVRTKVYTRLFVDPKVASKYFEKLCETGNEKNVKLLPGKLFRL